MAPTIKWQRWDSASYNWFGTASTDALPSLEAELDAWITTVNGNASNVGRSVTKERGYADSLEADRAGLVMSFGTNGNTSKGYYSYVTSSTSVKKLTSGGTYSDNTSNGGYGTVGGGTYDSSVSWRTSGYEASWLIISDTTDGQEYFCFGPSFGGSSNTYEEGFFIFKGTDGEWSMTSNDGASQIHVHYWNDGIGTEWGPCNRGINSDTAAISGSNYYTRYMLYAGTSWENSANPTDGRQYVYAANPDVLNVSSSGTYRETGYRRVLSDLGDGNNVYVLTGYYYGPSFLVDLRS